MKLKTEIVKTKAKAKPEKLYTAKDVCTTIGVFEGVSSCDGSTDNDYVVCLAPGSALYMNFVNVGKAEPFQPNCWEGYKFRKLEANVTLTLELK